jgi:hypothetical protein
MNEQIYKIARQADSLARERVPDLREIVLYNRIRDEKFAELIVQECIDIIAPYTVRMSRPGEEYLHPILEIKQHFGVEE